jgi:hypothetical protein
MDRLNMIAAIATMAVASVLLPDRAALSSESVTLQWNWALTSGKPAGDHFRPLELNLARCLNRTLTARRRTAHAQSSKHSRYSLKLNQLGVRYLGPPSAVL